MTLEQVSKAKAPAGTTPPPAAERDLGARSGEARLSGWHAQCGCGHIRREQQLPGGGRHGFYLAEPFRGVMEYGSMDDEVNGWFAWNPRFCFSSLVLAWHFGGMSTSGAGKGCMIRGETRRGPVSPGPM